MTRNEVLMFARQATQDAPVERIDPRPSLFALPGDARHAEIRQRLAEAGAYKALEALSAKWRERAQPPADAAPDTGARTASGPPADAAPDTMRSVWSAPVPPPDTHEPFLLTSARVLGAPRSRAPASPADSAQQPPTGQRQRPAEPAAPSQPWRLGGLWRGWARALGWGADGS